MNKAIKAIVGLLRFAIIMSSLLCMLLRPSFCLSVCLRDRQTDRGTKKLALKGGHDNVPTCLCA